MATAKKKTETKITLAQEIWERIKDTDLELFALPDQTVEVNASPILAISDTDLHILLKAQAALPQLEDRLRGFKWSKAGAGGFPETLEVSTKSKFTVIKVVPVED